MAVAAITINSFRSDIAKTDAGKKFLRTWDTVNTLIAVYGLTRLVISLPETFRNLRKAYGEFKMSASGIDPNDLSKLDAEAAKLLSKADEAIAEGEVAALRNKHTPEQLSAYEPQLAKAGAITDEAKRQAALADIERQMASQQENLALIDELKKANPKMTNKEIADLAAPRIKVPTVPHGMDAEEFQRAQEFIKKFLQDRGIKDAEGFATGSRITGVTFNPKKPAFGQASSSFAKKDFDITIITSPSRPLTKGEIKKLQDAYAAEFKHPLGVRAVSDPHQLGFIPVYGKLDLVLK
jgi:Sec-independent protein translocase protein TatA